MSLRNQPYLPLYVQDFLTDEKLIECSAATTGVYIRLMCIMHKSDDYGKILLKQKDKQNSSNVLNFASKLSKQMPYQVSEIESALTELITEKVLYIEDDVIYQKRMVHDNSVSEVRAISGQKGGMFAQAKFKANIQAKDQASTEYENEYENGIENENEFKYNSRAILKFEDLKKELMGSEIWIEETAMHLKADIPFLKQQLDLFLTDLKLKDDAFKPVNEVKSHFINWWRKTKPINNKPISTEPEKFPDGWDRNYYENICQDLEGYENHLKSLGFVGKFNQQVKQFEFIRP